jgi:pyrimidine-nucleoside phosphorylase
MDIKSTDSGYVSDIDALKIGQAAMRLGAGRETKESGIDLSAGILLHKKAGQPVSPGETLATLHYNPGRSLEEPASLVNSAFQIGDAPRENPPTVFKIIN